MQFDFDVAYNNPGSDIVVRAPRSVGVTEVRVTGWPSTWTEFPTWLVAYRGANRLGIFRIGGQASGILSGVQATEGSDVALKIGDRLAANDTAGNDKAIKTAIVSLGTTAVSDLQCSGDSMTAGGGLSNPATQSYPAVLAGLLGSGWTVANRGVGGATLDQLAASDITRVDPLWSWQSPARICSIFAGRNDLYFGTPVSQLMTDYAAYCRARRQAGYRVIAWTMLPGVPTGSWTTNDQQTFNAFVRANYGSFADALFDAAAVSGMTDPTGPNYQSDGVHPNESGSVLLAQGLYQVVLAIDNDNSVHLTGNETVGGNKMFTGNCTFATAAAGVFQTTGSNSGFTIARRDNNAAAFTVYSTAGNLQIFGYAAGVDIVTVDGPTGATAFSATVTAPVFSTSGAGSGYIVTSRTSLSASWVIYDPGDSIRILSFTTGEAMVISTADHTVYFSGTINAPNLNLSGMVDAANDAAAATAGVPVGGLYHNAGAVRIRLT